MYFLEGAHTYHSKHLHERGTKYFMNVGYFNEYTVADISQTDFHHVFLKVCMGKMKYHNFHEISGPHSESATVSQLFYTCLGYLSTLFGKEQSS